MRSIEPETPAHNRMEDDLKAYIDGELSLVRRTQLAQHLRSCAACRRKEEEMRKLTEQIQTLGAAGDTTLPAPLRTKLLATVPTGRAGDGPRALPLWRQKPGLVFGGGSAALAASFAAFAVLYGPMSHSAEDNATTVKATAEVDKVAEAAPSAVAAAGSVRAVPSANPSYDANGASVMPGQTTSATEMAADKRQASPPVVPGYVTFASPKRANSTAIRYRRAASAQLEPGVELQDQLADRQVHREASLGVAVSNVEAASANVERLVKESGGYVASNVLTTDEGGYKGAELTVKVPETSFEEMLTSISKLGNVRSKSITGEDITEKVSDATSDEQVLVDETTSLEDRLKAGNLSDKRTVQKEAELRQVRQQLARTRARLGLLRKLAHLSTLSVSLSEQAKVEKVTTPPSGFWSDLKDSNRSALKAFQAAVRVPLLLVIWAIALSPVWLPLLLVYRHLSRKQVLAQAPTEAVSPATPPSELDR